MRRVTNWIAAGIAGALALLGVGAAQAQVLSAIGQVVKLHEEAPGDVLVLHANGEATPATLFQWLVPGDRVKVTTAVANATVYDVGTRRTVRVVQSDGPRTITGADPGPHNPAGDAFFQGFDNLFQAEPQIAPTANGLNRIRTITPSPLLPVGPQHLISGPTVLGVIWRGGPGDVALAHANGKVVTVSASGNYASLLLKTGRLDGDYVLTIGKNDLVFPITVVDPSQAPTPPWLHGAPVTSDAERIIRAAWILREGPPDWRLFAIGELAYLAQRNYAADRLWTAVQARNFPGS